MPNAMDSYMALGGNELVNAARLKAYVDNGLVPYGFDITPPGCDGLEGIIPCVDSDPPVGGYQLPELDPAPWYDVAAPESANFAGLLVTSVTVSAPYSRSTTQNLGQGQTLGRLKPQGRTIVVHGWLIGKTCCATQYGMKWLTSVLGEPPCSDGGCGGTTMEFLECCPSIGDGEMDCLHTDDGVFVRPDADSEYQRAEDFFRRMNGVGTVDGPTELSCKGSNCGCGCSALLEVEFTLATSSPYYNTFGSAVLDEPMVCPEENPCLITWIKLADGESCPSDCAAPPADCLEDPNCPLPALPPLPTIPLNDCGCLPVARGRMCAKAAPILEWGSSTMNVDVYSGTQELRNLIIRVWQDPLNGDCADPVQFPECAACTTLFVTYVPPNSHLILSGELRTVTIECNGNSRNASQNVTNLEGQPFEWPDLTCVSACVCVDFSCDETSEDATITITRVDRSL